MKNLVIPILIVLIILSGCKENEVKPAVERSIKVRTAPVENVEISFPIRGIGRISLKSEQMLSFRTGGFIQSIFVNEGQTVNKGQVLAKLNLAEINAQKDVAEEALNKAERDYERTKNLYDDSVATLEQLQNVKTAFEVARAQLEVVRFNLKYSTITAPSKGKILKIIMEENEMTSPGNPVLLFGSLNTSWIIRTNLTDEDIIKVKLKDSVNIFTDAYEDEVFKGIVTERGSMADPYTGTFEVEVRLTDTKQKEFVNGIIARLEIIPNKKVRLKSIPIEAMFYSNETTGNIYELKEGKAIKHKINLIKVVNNKIFTNTPLSDDAIIITENMNYINGSAKIEVVE